MTRNLFYYRSPLDPSEIRGSSRDINRPLFENTARLRKLEVLIDTSTVFYPEPPDGVAALLRELLDQDNINTTYWIPNTTTAPINRDNYDELTPNILTTSTPIRDPSPFGYPDSVASFYQIRRIEGEAENVTYGSLFPTPTDIYISQKGINSKIAPGHLQRYLTLLEVEKKLQFDLIITDLHSLDESLPIVLNDSNATNPTDAVFTIAHYLRKQGEYIVDTNPFTTVNPDSFYEYAFYAYSPNFRHWQGKTDRAVEFHGHDQAIYAFYAHTTLARCSRALRRRDDLIEYLGMPKSMINVDDAIDSLDQLIVSLCAAIDSMARSLSEAVGDKNVHQAKLHDKNWVKRTLGPHFKDSPEYPILLDRIKRIAFLFKVRNSIHSIGLIPSLPDPQEGNRTMNRISVVIPPTSNDSWKNLPKEELAYWNLTTDQGNATADLACFAHRCLEAAFSFIDIVSEIASFEQIEGVSPVLFENIRGIEDDEGISASRFIASTMPLASPLLDGSYSPSEKRRLPSDMKSRWSQAVEPVLRNFGWKPNPDWTPLRTPPTFSFQPRRRSR